MATTTVSGIYNWPTLTTTVKAAIMGFAQYIASPAVFMRVDQTGITPPVTPVGTPNPGIALPRFLVISLTGTFTSIIPVTTRTAALPWPVPKGVNSFPDWGPGESPPTWGAFFLGDGPAAYPGSAPPTMVGASLSQHISDLASLIGDAQSMTLNWYRVLTAGGLAWLI